MHLNPRFKSNIFLTLIFPSNLLLNVQNNLKIFSLIFLYFYWHLFLCHFYFFSLSTVWRFVYLLLSRGLIPSWGTAYQHIGSTWPFGHLMHTGTKRPGKQVYASEAHSHMASLLSVYTHWGGEPCCHCTRYLLISFITWLLGSIYSLIQCLHSLRSLIVRPLGLSSYSKLLNTVGPNLQKLHFTSGYHPEGNRQTKHTNQTLEQHLQIYCNYQHSN